VRVHSSFIPSVRPAVKAPVQPSKPVPPSPQPLFGANNKDGDDEEQRRKLLAALPMIMFVSGAGTHPGETAPPNNPVGLPTGFQKHVLTPREIKARLDEYVIGQEDAKKAVALAVHSHFKRLGYQVSVASVERELDEVTQFNGTPKQKQAFLRDVSKVIRTETLSGNFAIPELAKLIQTAERQGLLSVQVKWDPIPEMGSEAEQRVEVAAESVIKALQQEQGMKAKTELWQRLNNLEMSKQNMIVIGPTGSGKTEIARTLARILDVPFAIQNASEITSAGYIGGKAEDVVGKLLESAKGDTGLAGRGIAFIDEIDKIRASQGPGVGKDVNGKGAQDSLLKIIEDAEVPVGKDKKVSTKDMLFVAAGAFEGLSDIIAKRMYKKQSIGFAPSAGKSPEKMTRSEKNALLKFATPDDLIEYGLAPEFVGRLPVVVVLEELDVNALKDIMIKPKNALLKQYTEQFRIDGVTLDVTDEALTAMAEYAIHRNTGARSLQSVMNAVFKDALFDVPDLEGPQTLTIDAQRVLNSLKDAFGYEPKPDAPAKAS